MKNGVDFDRAFDMDEALAFASAAIFGRFEGQEFDWKTLRWKRRT